MIFQTELFTLSPLILAQFGILWALVKRLPGLRRSRWFWVGVVLLFALGGCGLSLSLVRPLAPFFRPVRTVTMMWLIASAPAFLFYVFFRRLEPAVSPSRRELIRTAGALAIAAPFAIEAWGAIVTRREFQVQETDLPIVGLHPDLAGLKILQISDVHLSAFLSEREFARVIDAANELRPNVAVMTGDLISTWGDPVDACIAQLSRLKSDAPLLGCLGNHEIYTELEQYVEIQAARKGMTFLRHDRRELKFGAGVLNIAGIDYQPFPLKGHYLHGAAPLIRPGMTNLLLSHNPDVFTEAPEQGWHAMLAGHTHGGQVTVEIVKRTVNIARILTKYVSGLYLERGAACYVTRGIGTIGIPARIGAPPEITLLRLRKA